MAIYRIKRFTATEDALEGAALVSGAGAIGAGLVSHHKNPWSKYWRDQVEAQELRKEEDKLAKSAMKKRAKKLLKEDKLYKSSKRYRNAALALAGVSALSGGASYLNRKLNDNV